MIGPTEEGTSQPRAVTNGRITHAGAGPLIAALCQERGPGCVGQPLEDPLEVADLRESTCRVASLTWG